MALRESNWFLVFYLVVFVVMLAGVRGCNMAFNNRSLQSDGFTSNSKATGLTGHVEYTKYSDGSQDIKIYPGLGHRMWDSKLYQDIDGDGRVDRIRQNGAEWKFNRLSKMLIRNVDYKSNQEAFDSADDKLQELMKKNK